jgi:two-component system, NarL family, response regulator NreC
MDADVVGAGDVGLGDAITIVLADDQAIVRAALRCVLEAEPGFCVLAEAADLETTTRKVLAYKPDVLVLELHMPDGCTYETIPMILAISPATRIVILTMEDSPQAARASLRAGAVGFALKEAADTELVEAVRAAHAGHVYLDPELAGRAVSEPEVGPGEAEGLSPRELEVLKLVALGYTNTQIGGELHLSIRTVEAHRSHLQHKIHRSTRAEVSAYAREQCVV